MRDLLNRAVRRVPGWLIYLAGFGWMGWLFFRGASGALGPEPVEALEHAYGLLALQFLVAGLAVTPLRRWAGINLLPLRRQIGMMAFWFLCGHVGVWALLDLQSLSRIWAEIVKRPYITIGMAGLLCLLPLAATSTNAAIRRLGGAPWRRLHRLVYPAVALGALHFVWLAKGAQLEPFLYAAAVVGLLVLRAIPKRAGRRGKIGDSPRGRFRALSRG